MTVLQLLSEGIDSMLRPHITAFDNTQVSKYFYTTFNATWSAGLREDLQALTTKYWEYEIWVSGHSLGAATASVTATAIGYYFPTMQDRLTLVSPISTLSLFN